MPAVQITDPVELPDGTRQVVADVTDTPLAHDVETEDGRRLRYFEFGADVPDDAVAIVAAQLRAELPAPAAADPPAAAMTQTVEL